MVDERGKVYFDDDVATQYDLDIHTEQFTGLTDVNGKEIYAGDILHFGSTSGEYIVDDPND